MIKIKNNEFKKANTYLTLALELFNKSGTEYKGPKSQTYTKILNNYAFIMYKDSKYETAIKYVNESLKKCYINNYTKTIAENFELLFMIYEKLHQPDSALIYHKLYKTYSDSLYNENKIKQLTQIKMQYEFDKELKEKGV